MGYLLVRISTLSKFRETAPVIDMEILGVPRASIWLNIPSSADILQYDFGLPWFEANVIVLLVLK